MNQNAVISQGKFKEYDIINENTKYEIKCDRWTMISGNIAIEHSCFGKPSGIETTESDFYIYYVLNKNIKENIDFFQQVKKDKYRLF